MACGVWTCHQVGHVRQCAIWKNVLSCDIFTPEGIFEKKELEIVVFHPNFGALPFHTGIPTKNGSWMPKTQGKKGSSKFREQSASRTPCISLQHKPLSPS